jgi:superfamily I DNA/RNA helicase
MMNTIQENSELKLLKEFRKKTVKIFGPPGTGKTYTLIERVLKRHLKKGARPQQIAFLSFTNKAVNTAKERALEAFPQYEADDFNKFNTLHKYCRKFFEEEVFDPKDCMIDYALQNHIVKRTDSRLSEDDFTYKDWSLQIYSKARNLRLSPTTVYKQEAYKRDSLDVFVRKIRTYEHYKTSGGERSFIDFDDMIERAIYEVNFTPLDILILDEAQDCTPLQWDVIYKMAKNVNRIYLAGDDDQGIYKWNGADPSYFTDYFPGRKVRLRKTRRFGEAIHHFSQIIRRGIQGSIEKEYLPSDKDGYVKSYFDFSEIPIKKEKGTWFILGRINSTVNELRMIAKDAGLYFKDNHENKCFDQRQWQAIKSWTRLSNGKKINKHDAQNLYRYIRELTQTSFRGDKFWIGEPDFRDYSFEELKDWCGLAIPDKSKKKPWYWILRRNFKPKQTRHFIRLLRNYGQEELDQDPKIIIDTIHSVKGDEADHVVMYSKGNYASDFGHKKRDDKTDERKVWYTGVTRAKRTLHLLRTDYKYNYPIGADYLIYIKEKMND